MVGRQLLKKVVARGDWMRQSIPIHVADGQLRVLMVPTADL